MGKKWECNLVSAHGDKELGSCIGVFPGVEKNQSVLRRNKAGFHLLD